MSRDTQARIFEPFFSTKETNIGLGLTAVYGTVKQNGGTLAVESRPGQGTVVQIFFPGAAWADVREEPLAKTLLAKGDETILLVNEDEIDRKLAASVLARHHYAVLEAASSTEAMLVSSQHRGSVQLAVSPLLMPEIEGRDLARQLMIQHPAMKALFVSSYDEEAMQHHRINRKYVLQHPYRQAGLVEKVREILDAA
jgi:CheY-like chemotaxis protein